MPSLFRSIFRGPAGDMINIVGQKPLITIPPVMKVAAVSSALVGPIEVLPPEAGKYYIIHGYYMMVQNTAAEACTFYNLIIKDFETGETVSLDSVQLVANQVNVEYARMSGLNVATQPGKSVYIQGDAAPAHVNLCLYYSEVTGFE